MRSILVASLVLAACSSDDPASDGCRVNRDCDAGSVCIQSECRRLCTTDKNCGDDHSCETGSICRGDVCEPGCRSGTPQISGVNGDGSSDSDGAHASNHIASGLIISGTNLEGADVQLLGTGIIEAEVASGGSDTQLTALLPTSLQPGSYTLRVSNQLGSDQTDITVLQGERGPQGPEGPRPLIEAGGGITGDGQTATPLRVDYGVLDARYAPASIDTQPPAVTTAQRDALSPQPGWLVFNSDTGEMNFYDGAGWKTLATGFAIKRASTLLRGDITIHQTTPTWTLPIAGLPNNARAVIIGLYYVHNGAANHGYLSFWAYQSGRASSSEDAALVWNSHYNDYFNTDYYEFFVPWDPALADDLVVEVSSSYNSSAENKYHIYFKGWVESN